MEMKSIKTKLLQLPSWKLHRPTVYIVCTKTAAWKLEECYANVCTSSLANKDGSKWSVWPQFLDMFGLVFSVQKWLIIVTCFTLWWRVLLHRFSYKSSLWWCTSLPPLPNHYSTISHHLPYPIELRMSAADLDLTRHSNRYTPSQECSVPKFFWTLFQKYYTQFQMIHGYDFSATDYGG